ncbi:hypothetical protein HDE_14031 [Halotydeus destructor]|nr:hypothetical protein HDE_14031 [Halotydeus destructor]
MAERSGEGHSLLDNGLQQSTNYTGDLDDAQHKRKHLNVDCPHRVPLDFKVVSFEPDSVEEPEKHGWFYKLLFGSKDNAVKKRKYIWPFLGGFSCILLVSGYIVYRYQITEVKHE